MSHRFAAGSKDAIELVIPDMLGSKFEAEMRAQIPRLRRYARALSGDAMRADDLVQETLARGWEKRSLWQPGSDLRAWLFAIMHNLFVNEIRRRVPLATDLDAVAEVASPDWLPEQALLLRDLARALAMLSADQRAVVLLVGLEGMRYEEAARVLSVPIGTVMSRLSRARDQLRLILDGSNVQATLRVVK